MNNGSSIGGYRCRVPQQWNSRMNRTWPIVVRFIMLSLVTATHLEGRICLCTLYYIPQHSIGIEQCPLYSAFAVLFSLFRKCYLPNTSSVTQQRTAVWSWWSPFGCACFIVRKLGCLSSYPIQWKEDLTKASRFVKPSIPCVILILVQSLYLVFMVFSFWSAFRQRVGGGEGLIP